MDMVNCIDCALPISHTFNGRKTRWGWPACVGQREGKAVVEGGLGQLIAEVTGYQLLVLLYTASPIIERKNHSPMVQAATVSFAASGKECKENKTFIPPNMHTLFGKLQTMCL
eukprot:scaffold2059_cov33-Attheya_sp.AAC.2